MHSSEKTNDLEAKEVLRPPKTLQGFTLFHADTRGFQCQRPNTTNPKFRPLPKIKIKVAKHYISWLFYARYLRVLLY